MPDAEKPAKTTERQYGVGHKLVGKNYPTPDLYAKVTGAAKYAEDFRAEGMLFCKLLLSPMPHARVKHIDASEALAMPGVRAILTANDLPAPADTLTDNGTVIKPANGANAASPWSLYIRVNRSWLWRLWMKSPPRMPSKKSRLISSRFLSCRSTRYASSRRSQPSH